MPPENIINRRRLYQQVADNLENRILDGTFPVGSRLPSEQELADQYGVSRNVVREALKRLKEHGLVTIRTGSGTYVREPSTQSITDAFNRLLRHNTATVSLAHFYEIRRMIEPQSALLAAQKAHPEDIAAIRAAYELMKQQQHDSAVWSKADLNFHRAVAAATHNPLISSILDPLAELMSEVISAGRNDPSGISAGLNAHKSILEAIEQRQPDAAHRAMLDHLSDSEARMSKLGINKLESNQTDDSLS